MNNSGINEEYLLSIVVDGRSEDPFIKKEIKSICEQIIPISKNIGIFAEPCVTVNGDDLSVCAKGRYTLFLNSDTRWENGAVAKAIEILEEHSTGNSKPGTCDICMCRIMYEGEFSEKTHPLDYRFDGGDRVVSVIDEPQAASSFIYSSVIRSSALDKAIHMTGKSEGHIDERTIVSRVLVNNKNVALLASAVVFYRRRSDSIDRKELIEKMISSYSAIPGIHRDSTETLPAFIQTLILNDFRTLYTEVVMSDPLSEKDMAKYTEQLGELLRNVDDKRILSSKRLNQYYRLNLLDMKYNKSVISSASLKGTVFKYNNATVLNLRTPNMLMVKVFDIRNDMLVIDGITRLSVLDRPFELYALTDDGTKYKAGIDHYEKADLTGCLGSVISEGCRFHIEVPLGKNMSIELRSDIIETSEENPSKKNLLGTVALKPYFDKYIGLTGSSKFEYIRKGGYIIHFNAPKLLFRKDSAQAAELAEIRYSTRMTLKEGLGWSKERRKEFVTRRKTDKAKLKKRVAFITTRSEDELIDNMKCVYDALDLPKVFFAKKMLAKDPDYLKKAALLASSSKVVVTDNYLVTMRDIEKKAGQKYVQLWHSTGFAKHFGQDGSDIFPAKDALYHRDYDYVTASSDGVRYTYASAFGIPVDRIEASGIARTDVFFDEAYIKNRTNWIYEKCPELRNKEIILYVPTFRDIPGIPRSIFVPDLDFGKLSASLRKEQLFVICPHPLMTEPILDRKYENIIEMRDIRTADMMFAASLLITDYSSVMFDFSLLRRPMAFFCYDYDTYDRGFYLDFENELPGPLLKTQEELFSFLKKEEYPLLDDFESFYEKNLGACDGHSTERIVQRIKELFEEE